MLKIQIDEVNIYKLLIKLLTRENGDFIKYLLDFWVRLKCNPGLPILNCHSV